MNNANGRRVVEWIKTALIMLLTVSAVLLGAQTRLFNDFFNSITLVMSIADFFNRSPAVVEPQTGIVTKEAARPLSIVVTDENGGRYGVKYDSDARNTLYDRTSGVLGEALGSALIPTEVGEPVWREALTGPGVYFEYTTAVRLDVLCGWLGAPAQDGREFTLRRVCVTFGEDMNKLYFQDEESGLFYSAETASSGGAPESYTQHGGDGILFAFETGILPAAENAPYMLILPDTSHPEARVNRPATPREPLDLILAAFGESYRNNSAYTEPDGTVNYVGSQFTVRVAPDGHAIYRRAEEAAAVERIQYGDGGLIERARIVTADTLGKNCGDAELNFSGAEYSDNGAYTVTFSYYLAGGLIHMGQTPAAKVTIEGGVITELDLYFRRFEITDEYVDLITERQALAASGGEFLLYYTDGGVDRLMPGWFH